MRWKVNLPPVLFNALPHPVPPQSVPALQPNPVCQDLFRSFGDNHRWVRESHTLVYCTNTSDHLSCTLSMLLWDPLSRKYTRRDHPGLLNFFFVMATYTSVVKACINILYILWNKDFPSLSSDGGTEKLNRKAQVLASRFTQSPP